MAFFPRLAFNDAPIVSGKVLICRGARIILHPQRPEGTQRLRVMTAAAPRFQPKFKFRYYRF
jgi:hypothetical protein